jgi:hypothetical protein
MSLNRIVSSASVLLLMMAAIGCQSGGAASSTASGPPVDKAVLITTGNGTSTVYIPASNGAGVERLAADKEAPVCKQCQEDAEAYFKSGVISPKCPVCGANRVPLHAIN